MFQTLRFLSRCLVTGDDKSMYYFIMNPTASSGVGRKVWKQLKPILKTRGVKYKLIAQTDKEELIAIVKKLTGRNKKLSFGGTIEVVDAASEEEIKDKDVHLVVLGGDGTLNLVFNSIVDLEHTKLSCIRIGSGNDFARNVGIEKAPEKALIKILDDPEEVVLDYGEADYVMVDGMRKSRKYVISSGIGYDADICQEASHSKIKKVLNVFHLGKLVYVTIGIKQIFSRSNTRAKIYLDGKGPLCVRNLFFAVGMVHEMEGGGVPFCPDADPEDGKLDVCLAKGAPIPKLLTEVAMVYCRKHLLFSNVSMYRCRSIRIVVDNPQWIHTDGETPCKVRQVIMSCRQGLRLVK